MISETISNEEYIFHINIYIKKKHLYQLFCIITFFLFILRVKINEIQNSYFNDANVINYKNKKEIIPNNICYIPLYNPSLKIIHLIITRFMIEFENNNDFTEKMYTNEYIQNGISVLKKYLIPSLKSQTCNDFIWILLIGDKFNITYIKSLLSFTIPFKYEIIYQKEFRKYMLNITSLFDVFISTRIDYDDRIYYDAVNDVRKQININKPILLYGYNSGVYYFESIGKYYEYYKTNAGGALGLFLSLIILTKKVNNTIYIFDIGDHTRVRELLLKNYTAYGIKKLYYDPGIFDTGSPKFVYIRQKYSHSYNVHLQRKKNFKELEFQIKHFS